VSELKSKLKSAEDERELLKLELQSRSVVPTGAVLNRIFI